jgi:hypothetical protein
MYTVVLPAQFQIEDHEKAALATALCNKYMTLFPAIKNIL